VVFSRDAQPLRLGRYQQKHRRSDRHQAGAGTANVKDAMSTLLLILLTAGCAAGADDLRGAGATFPYPLYAKWFAAFEKRYPGPPIAYRQIGSVAGIEALSKGEIDFAGSDIPLSDEQLSAIPGKVCMIPTVVGGIVPIYRLDGVLEDLRFTPEI